MPQNNENNRCMHNEEGTCMEILTGTDNTNNSNKLSLSIFSYTVPASSGMVSSSPDVPDVPSAKRITRFIHICASFATQSVLNGYLHDPTFSL